MATVTLTRDGHRATLTLDRPPLNVLDLDMLGDLDAALAPLAGDDAIAVLAVRGAGKAFCAGVDVADHAPDRVARMLSLFHGAIRRLRDLPFPTVAVVHGAALGGGCELALACDLVFASEAAKIGQPEIRLGVFPPVAAALLPSRIGLQRALDLVLSGRVIRGHEAAAIGLAAQAWPADAFADGVEARLCELARASTPVLRLAKRAVGAGARRPFDAALDEAERLYAGELMALADAREGIAAFLEKREPVWRNA